MIPMEKLPPKVHLRKYLKYKVLTHVCLYQCFYLEINLKENKIRG